MAVQAAGAGAAGGGMAAAMPWVAVALIASGAIGQAYTSYQMGKSQRDYYKFLSDQSKLKAQLTMQAAQENIGYIQDQSARAGHKLKLDVNQAEAQQKAAMVAQGMSLNSVTAEDIMKDNISKMKLDEMAIRYNAELSSYQTERAAIMQSFDLNAQGMSQQLSGGMAYWTGQQQAYSSLIGGAGNSLMAYSALSRGGSNNQQSSARPSGSGSVDSGYGGWQNYQGYGQRPSSYA